eukprot:Polyplicarium_translucidae@DN3272_c0_g1_i8.p1
MKTAAVFFVVLLQLGAHAVDCGLYSYSPGFRNNWFRSPAPCSTPVSSDPQSFTNLFSGIPDEEACLVWCNGVIECEAYVYDPPNQRCALLDATQMEAVDFTPGPFVFGPHCGEDPSPSVPDPLLCGEPRMDVCVPPLQEIVGVPCRLRAAASVKS